ncbi:MAG: NAD(P)H-dependent oxidoreductase [Flavobacteriia bacterium]
MHPIISDLNWRYAVKKYDSGKKISEENITILKEAIRLSPSSVGLQGYVVLDIQNPEIRQKLKEASHNQTQVSDASHYFVFCYPKEIHENYLDKMISHISEIRNQSIESLSGYKNMIYNLTQNQSEQKKNQWLTNQAYIALGNLLQSAAHLKIDATPMEGFNYEKYEEILELDQKGLKVAVACALGYRSEEDKYQHLKKYRKPIKDLFSII